MDSAFLLSYSSGIAPQSHFQNFQRICIQRLLRLLISVGWTWGKRRGFVPYHSGITVEGFLQSQHRQERLITLLTYIRACEYSFTVRQTLKCKPILLSQTNESRPPKNPIKKHFLTRYMRCEGNKRYEAEHFGQVHIGCLAPVHQLSALDDGV